MSKKRPKKSKFKIPSKNKKRRTKNKQEDAEPYFPFKNFNKLSKEDRDKLNRLNEFYISAMRTFYNSIADENLKVPPETIFLSFNKLPLSTGFFDMDAVANDVLFHFMGDSNKEVLEALITILIETTGENIKELNNDSVVQLLWSYYEAQGYTPLKNKILCVVQETPSPDFFDRDEVIIDIHNPELINQIGILGSIIHRSLKENLNVEKLKVKVINKINNPKAYKNYLKLKQIMKRVEELEESVS